MTYWLLVVMVCLGWPDLEKPKPVVPQKPAATTVPAEVPTTANTDWPQFRGPDGQGHGVGEKLPSKWSELTNIAWKTDLPGRGWSSPVVQGNNIWVTAAVTEGSSLKLLRVDKTTGKLEQEITVFQVPTPGQVHSKNGHASPTPIVENGRIYVHFGAHGTACVEESGKILWKTALNYYHHHGPAASPILVGSRLIVPCDGYEKSFYDGEMKSGVTDFQFVTALNIDTGNVDWRTARKGRHSYATPLLIEVDGKQQIISPGGDRVAAYDPATGAEIWSVRYTGYSLIPRPVYGHGLLFICTGYDNAQLLAIRPDGQGDVTDTHVAWSFKQGIPFTPSPILVDDELYFVNDGGVGTCLDAVSGKMIWKRRFGGNFSASPIVADQKIYFVAEDGTTHVVVPGKQYKRLGTNRVNGTTFASPAVSGTALFLRSDKTLYRIEEGAKAPPKSKAASKPAKNKTTEAD
ncbi:MAG: PQQ-binding-like beta-propeller repeat protein [Planctomycetota bacterium]